MARQEVKPALPARAEAGLAYKGAKVRPAMEAKKGERVAASKKKVSRAMSGGR